MAAKKAASKNKPKAAKKGKKKAQAKAAPAAATEEKKAKKPAAKKAKASKKPAKSGSKTKRAKSKNKAKKAAPAAAAPVAAAPAAKKPAKKKAKNKPKKKAAKKAKAKPAKKKAAKKPAKKKAAKKAAPKKAKAKKKAAAPKKKAAKKPAKKKAVRETITATGPTTAKAAKKRTKNAKKTKTTDTFKNKKGEKWTVTRRFAANPIDGALNFVVLSGGAILGFEAADMLDRWVATRTPSGAKFPWYGTDAAHRQMQRPDGMRVLAMAGLSAAFFAGAVFTRKRFVKTSYFLGGVALGSILKLGHAVLAGWVWPKAFGVEKGTERSFGNRMYPLEQAKLQELAKKKIDADNKLATDAVTNKTPDKAPAGQQDADTKGALPASYAYPTDATKDWTYGVGRAGTTRTARVERSLPAAQTRPAAATATRAVAGYDNEPVARPAPQGAVGRAATLGCRDEECGRPGCPSCGDDRPMSTQFESGASASLANQDCLDATGARSKTDANGVCLPADSGPSNPPSDGTAPPAVRMSPSAEIRPFTGPRGGTTAGTPSLEQILKGNITN
jgi:hypothetical protein